MLHAPHAEKPLQGFGNNRKYVCLYRIAVTGVKDYINEEMCHGSHHQNGCFYRRDFLFRDEPAGAGETENLNGFWAFQDIAFFREVCGERSLRRKPVREGWEKRSRRQRPPRESVLVREKFARSAKARRRDLVEEKVVASPQTDSRIVGEEIASAKDA